MLPNSRFTVETAAMQGVYNSVNTKKLKAQSGENNDCNALPSSAIFAPVNTANVLITVSLAVNPVISAVDMRQSEKPIGMNITLINRPIDAKILSALSATVFKRISKDCKNQIMIVAKKITVKAL